jgi:hypothetical protein
MSCGSDANMYAIISASDGDTSRCLVAAGSYIAGDDGLLQCWSTNTFSLKEGVSTVSTPEEVRNPFTRRQTVALPYSIQGVLSAKRQKEYENACFKELHVRCLLAKMKSTFYKCIMLELMLAGNGASLSDRALKMLGRIAECHNLCIVVDEIMTAGHTGNMLMLHGKPKEFTKHVTHVTLGKWIHSGLVLVTQNFLDATTYSMSNRDHTSRRGSSITADCKQVLATWNEALTKLSNCTVC